MHSFVRGILVFTLSSSVILTPVASAKEQVRPGSSLIRATYLTGRRLDAAAAEMRKALSDDGKLLIELQKRFGAPADAEFFWKLKRQEPRQFRPTVRVSDGDTIVIAAKGVPDAIWTNLNPFAGTGYLNGKPFRVGDYPTLEAAHAEVLKILETDRALDSTSIYDLLVPSAQAMSFLVFLALAALGLGANALVAYYGYAKLPADIAAAADECERRDPKVPYAKSKTAESIRGLQRSASFELTGRIDDCLGYAHEQASFSLGEARIYELCVPFQRLQRCYDDYRNGRPPVRGVAEPEIPHAPPAGVAD